MTTLEQARATLDGVEVDAWIESWPRDGLTPKLAHYSYETVESLLQAHELRIRKQVLLEAEEHFNGKGAWSEHHLRNELRRMAEGEK